MRRCIGLSLECLRLAENTHLVLRWRVRRERRGGEALERCERFRMIKERRLLILLGNEMITEDLIM